MNEAHAKRVDPQNPERWPRDCQRVNIWKVEEKKSDVSLALHAFKDAILGEIDHAVIVTNDTDIQPALEMSMKSSDVYKWLQQPNPYWGHALPLDMLSNEKDGQTVLDFMTHWHGSRSTSFDPSSP